MYCITVSTVLAILISSVLSLPQQPIPPPDTCFRRNDSMNACPYGGKCFPNQEYTCQTSCIDFRAFDSRFFCHIPCGYKATSLQGEIAVNPLLCLQPTRKNGFTCESGWACYRKFGTREPFRTQGPVCSPSYEACKLGVVPSSSGGTNSTTAKNSPGSGISECGANRACIVDPRWEFARPTVPEFDDSPGICAPVSKTCSGTKWDECGDTEHCVSDPSCKGKLGSECRGLCIKILGPLWGTVNATDLRRRTYTSTERRMC